MDEETRQELIKLAAWLEQGADNWSRHADKQNIFSIRSRLHKLSQAMRDAAIVAKQGAR